MTNPRWRPTVDVGLGLMKGSLVANMSTIIFIILDGRELLECSASSYVCSYTAYTQV